MDRSALAPHLKNCLRLSVPGELIYVANEAEILASIEACNRANAAMEQFWRGEISEDDFLSLVECYTNVDHYIENANDNLISWIGHE